MRLHKTWLFEDLFAAHPTRLQIEWLLVTQLYAVEHKEQEQKACLALLYLTHLGATQCRKFCIFKGEVMSSYSYRIYYLYSHHVHLQCWVLISTK